MEAIRHLVGAGYPQNHFVIESTIQQFGSEGRNKFRSDFAILDVPAGSIDTSNVEDLLEHCLLLCEVKRDNSNFNNTKHFQVKPMLQFATRRDCIGLYWDNVIQRVYWQKYSRNKREVKEGPLSFLPRFGNKINVRELTIGDLKESEALATLFSRIEDILHQATVDGDKRYETILQLVLAKLFDEHAREKEQNTPLEIQDFVALETDLVLVKKKMDSLLIKSVNSYQHYLPKQIPRSFDVKPRTLVDVLTLLAPVRLTTAKREVIQTFYMKFAKELYKWKMAQYFTPITITDFIIDVLNPQYGEHIKDPACGSADFLTAAFRRGRDRFDRYSDYVWGSDSSEDAVQVAVLNMLLSGDGKTNISKEDSLASCKKHAGRFDIIVCNPPFGTKIVEKHHDILADFDLGYKWTLNSHARLQKSTKVLNKQETGILFIETCVRQAKPGGRIGIILPNGYLGNRSEKYKIMREWLLRNCFLVAICPFPRFTFKASGADVSASVVFLEKRNHPMNAATESEDYYFDVEMVQTVGWDVGKKQGKPIFKRNKLDGSYMIGENGQKILDADFEDVLERVRNSRAADRFPWLTEGCVSTSSKDGGGLSIRCILDDADLTMDPKRYSRKFLELRQEIRTMDHFKLGDVLESIPRKTTRDGQSVLIHPDKIYRYVEIQDIDKGDFRHHEMRGWELPVRAQHFAESGDIFISSIWGSVEKWCMIGNDAVDYVVTNGCHRFRLKEGKNDVLHDLLAFLCTESFAVQMRALARGSDGLAEVTVDDANAVLVPRIGDEARAVLAPFVKNFRLGMPSFPSTVHALANSSVLRIPLPGKRPNHTVLV